MSTPPRISIVTPSYGQLDWLRLAVASVADQTGVTVEHIVQDAGTQGIEDSLPSSRAADDARYSMKLFVEKDRGMYDAINQGLSKASGDICAYLNCDEQFLPGALERVASFFDAHQDVEVLFGDAILIDNKGNPISYRRIVLPTLSHVRHVHLNTQSCSMFFRRSLIDRGFFFDSKWKAIGDQVWIEQLLLSDIRMATLKEPLAVFTFTGQNLGATSASEEETVRYRGRMPAMTRLQKAATVILHRCRKFLAGAYRSREIQIDIYTPGPPLIRQRRHRRIGFSWPNDSRGG